LQRRFGPGGRAFSKVVHSPAVERTSEALAKTVFRPSISLGASFAALLVGGAFYLSAKRYGFRLSGFESMAAIVAGGLLGGLIEGVGRLFRRRR
jgi:hypothetical protein